MSFKLVGTKFQLPQKTSFKIREIEYLNGEEVETIGMDPAKLQEFSEALGVPVEALNSLRGRKLRSGLFIQAVKELKKYGGNEGLRNFYNHFSRFMPRAGIEHYYRIGSWTVQDVNRDGIINNRREIPVKTLKGSFKEMGIAEEDVRGLSFDDAQKLYDSVKDVFIGGKMGLKDVHEKLEKTYQAFSDSPELYQRFLKIFSRNSWGRSVIDEIYFGALRIVTGITKKTISCRDVIANKGVISFRAAELQRFQRILFLVEGCKVPKYKLTKEVCKMASRELSTLVIATAHFLTHSVRRDLKKITADGIDYDPGRELESLNSIYEGFDSILGDTNVYINKFREFVKLFNELKGFGFAREMAESNNSPNAKKLARDFRIKEMECISFIENLEKELNQKFPGFQRHLPNGEIAELFYR